MVEYIRDVETHYPGKPGKYLTRFCFNREDPLVLRLQFTGGPEWVVGRDVLIEGMAGAADPGGDITIARTNPETLMVEFRSHEAKATVYFDARHIAKFLEECSVMSPVGEERVSEALDTFLTDLFKEEA